MNGTLPMTLRPGPGDQREEDHHKLHLRVTKLSQQLDNLETDLCAEIDARLTAEREDNERDDRMQQALGEICRQLEDLTQAIAMINRRAVHQHAWDISDIKFGGTLDRS
jgi:hypothetical protein